jgi:hypothetical protein
MFWPNRQKTCHNGSPQTMSCVMFVLPHTGHKFWVGMGHNKRKRCPLYVLSFVLAFVPLVKYCSHLPIPTHLSPGRDLPSPTSPHPATNAFPHNCRSHASVKKHKGNPNRCLSLDLSMDAFGQPPEKAIAVDLFLVAAILVLEVAHLTRAEDCASVLRHGMMPSPTLQLTTASSSTPLYFAH